MLPLAPNTTCDIYHPGHEPPGDTPDVAGVPCHLSARFYLGVEHGEPSGVGRYTHVLLVGADVDIPDGYEGQNVCLANNTVAIPDQNGTRFYVRFVELRNRGTAAAYKKVFLARRFPTFPTTEL